MSDSWADYVVRYQVRDHLHGLDSWSWNTSQPMSKDRARGLAEDLNADPGENIRDARVFIRTWKDVTLKPVLLDIYCGAGGATKGYQEAGFYVVGVDVELQPDYCGDDFIQADAIDYLKSMLSQEWSRPVGFDAIHASPPCQRYSSMSSCRPGLAENYPDLIDQTRDLLIQTGLPYVIENVPGSPLRDPVTLCGTMFERELYRHRLFETNFPLTAPQHPKHVLPASKAGHWKPGTVMSVAGHMAPIAHAREIMGIDWMNRAALGEAIPPAYTAYVGGQLWRHLHADTIAAYLKLGERHMVTKEEARKVLGY